MIFIACKIVLFLTNKTAKHGYVLLPWYGCEWLTFGFIDGPFHIFTELLQCNGLKSNVKDSCLQPRFQASSLLVYEPHDLLIQTIDFF
jgi:hypothetical protein